MKLDRWRLSLAAGAASVLAVVAACPAQAAPVVDLTSPGGLYPSDGYTLGFEFEVPQPPASTALAVYGLGVFDLLPMTQTAFVGLWDTSGDLLTLVAIQPGDGFTDGFFRYAYFAPLQLTPGEDYIVGAFEPGTQSSSLNTGQGGTGAYQGFDVIEDRFSASGAFSFPDQSDGYAGGSWLGANIEFTYQVPEPASWALMLLGFGAMGMVLRHRRGAAAVLAD